MDSELTAPELARELGVSLPAAHRLLDRHGISAPGKGRVRKAPRTLLDDTLDERGAVPVVFSGMSKSQMRVLAALSRAPLGLGSARQVAERAGVSPTVASRELTTLEAQGLAHRQERTVAADRARVRAFWTTDLRSWPGSLMQAVNQTVLPRAKRRRSKVATRIPARFGHLFWNADFSKLSPAVDASYIAGRMLASPNVGAWAWALENLPDDGIDTALSRRGMPVAARALVENWRVYG
ncbi:MAG: MarR family transcriptional regulator [Lacisediminihabitans sp.]